MRLSLLSCFHLILEAIYNKRKANTFTIILGDPVLTVPVIGTQEGAGGSPELKKVEIQVLEDKGIGIPGPCARI